MSDQVEYPIKSWKNVEIEQQCKFGFTKEVCEKLLDWASVDQIAFIKHDKDIDTEDHMDCMIKFKDSVPTQAILNKLNKLAGCYCIRFEHLSKIKSSWANALAYLCHWNSPLKHQYDASEVTANFDWQILAKKAISPIKDQVLLNYINMINEGILTRYNYYEIMPNNHYTAYNHRLEKAWKYYDDKRISEIKNGSYDMQVIFISGSSGSYKTTLAKKICREKNLEFSISSSKNDPFQDYKGEPAFILDDLRGVDFDASDLFKVLDHNTRTSCSSRFYNKFLFTELIIITSVDDIDTFFSDLNTNKREPVTQLFRRCNLYLKVNDYDIRVYQYDNINKKYQPIAQYKNTLKSEFPKPELTEDIKNKTKSFFDNLLEPAPEIKPIDHDLQPINEIDTDILPDDFKPQWILLGYKIKDNGLKEYEFKCSNCGHKIYPIDVSGKGLPNEDKCSKCKTVNIFVKK